jgi:hypothetical protein
MKYLHVISTFAFHFIKDLDRAGKAGMTVTTESWPILTSCYQKARQIFISIIKADAQLGLSPFLSG